MESIVYNLDCLPEMKKYKDDFFDLAIVDPPYGIFNGGKSGFLKHSYDLQQEANSWDVRPTREYFDQLFRISKNQIIWGAQYLAEFLPSFSTLIIWDKMTGDSYFADGEAAYCSIKGTLRIFRHQWAGCYKQSERGNRAIQPCQKPVALYDWLYKKYTKPGMMILDTHLGSGGNRIAAHKAECNFIGYEINKKYFDQQEKRWKAFMDQGRFF